MEPTKEVKLYVDKFNGAAFWKRSEGESAVNMLLALSPGFTDSDRAYISEMLQNELSATGQDAWKKPLAEKVIIAARTSAMPGAAQSISGVPGTTGVAGPKNAEQVDPAINALKTEISALQERVSALEPEVRFTELRAQIESFSQTVNGLSSSLAQLRSQGYASEPELEGMASAYTTKWNELRPDLLQQMERQTALLQPIVDPVVLQTVQLGNFANNPLGAQPLLTHLKAAVADLETNTKTAQEHLSSALVELQGQEVQLRTHIQFHIQSMETLSHLLEGVPFQLQADEHALLGVKADWLKPDADKIAGLLVLTNRRLLFERKEEIATKKFLFVTTESKQIIELLLDVSTANLQDVGGSKKGFFANEDHIDVTFTTGSPVGEAHFHLLGQDSMQWALHLNKAKDGELN